MKTEQLRSDLINLLARRAELDEERARVDEQIRIGRALLKHIEASTVPAPDEQQTADA